MEKEDLKLHVKELKLTEDVESLVFKIIDNSSTVDEQLINTISDILDLHADFYEKAADILAEKARAQDSISDLASQNLSTAREELVDSVSKKIEEINLDQSVNETTPPPAEKPQASQSQPVA